MILDYPGGPYSNDKHPIGPGRGRLATGRERPWETEAEWERQPREPPGATRSRQEPEEAGRIRPQNFLRTCSRDDAYTSDSEP